MLKVTPVVLEPTVWLQETINCQAKVLEAHCSLPTGVGACPGGPYRDMRGHLQATRTP